MIRHGRHATTRNQYLGGDTSMSCSEQTQREIDRKVVELVRTEHERAHSLLTEHRRAAGSAGTGAV